MQRCTRNFERAECRRHWNRIILWLPGILFCVKIQKLRPCSVQFPVEPHRHKHGDHGRDNICSRLGVENAVYSPEGWEKQYDRHKADSLSAGTEYKTFFRFSQREEQGRIDGIETEEQKRNTVCRQRTPADLDHLYIAFCELGDDGRGTECHSQPEDCAEDG